VLRSRRGREKEGEGAVPKDVVGQTSCHSGGSLELLKGGTARYTRARRYAKRKGLRRKKRAGSLKYRRVSSDWGKTDVPKSGPGNG